MNAHETTLQALSEHGGMAVNVEIVNDITLCCYCKQEIDVAQGGDHMAEYVLAALTDAGFLVVDAAGYTVHRKRWIDTAEAEELFARCRDDVVGGAE